MGNPTFPAPPPSAPVLSPLPVVVGVADLKECVNPEGVITTFALGSCLGITCYDPVRKIGALLHAMLPDSKNHSQARPAAAMFLDTGVTALLQNMLRLGASPERCEFKVFGGSHTLNAADYFNIGPRNVAMMRALATQHHLRVRSWNVGGQVNRTIKFYLKNGQVLLRMPSQPEITV